MDNKKIGEFIKTLRKEKGLSQNELSEILHITRQAISNWETGKASPDPELLITLSEFFQVPINAILLGEKEVTEEKAEKVTLQLLGDNKKKSYKIKRQLIVFTTIIFLLVFSFLTYYFVSNYNSIKVYRVGATSERFDIPGGLMIHTKNKTYIKIGSIEKNNSEDEINLFEIYLKDDKGNSKLLHSSKNPSIDIIEIMKGRKVNLKELQKKVYLRITYNGNQKEIINISFNEVFKNDLNNYAKIETSKILKPVKEDNTQPLEEEIKEEQKVEEVNQEIKQEPEPEQKLETPVPSNPPEEVVPEQNNTIDYNQVVNLLNQQSGNQVVFEDGNRIISIKLENNIIIIEMMENNNILGYSIMPDKQDNVFYEKYEDYFPVFSDYIINDESTEEIIKMNEILRLFINNYS